MKILTKEEADAHYRTTVVGGVKGFSAGLVASLAGSYLLYGRSPYYRALPTSLKALGIIVITAPACVIQAEHASDKFQREHWTGVGKMEMDDAEARRIKRWEGMSVTERAWDYAGRHQFGVVVGLWGAGMLGAGGALMRDKYMTMPQKLVQVRMWAQGITILSIIASAALFSSSPKGEKHEDHSWRDILEEEARLEKMQKEQAEVNVDRQVSMGGTGTK